MIRFSPILVLSSCDHHGGDMVLVSARVPALALCLVASGSVTVDSSVVSRVKRHVGAFAHANVVSSRFHTTSVVTNSKSLIEMRQESCFCSRVARSWPRRTVFSHSGCARLSAVGDGEVEGSEEGEGGTYVPTETLLNNPDHMERILASMAELAPSVKPLEGVFRTAVNHHCAVRTSNITRALKFYSLLGMKEVVRFRAEDARCAFLEGAGMRLELIEVPASMQPADKAADLAVDMRSTGLNHIAFDVGPAIEAEGLDGLRGFLSELNRQSEDAFGMSVRLVVSPYEQRIGQEVFDLAFIMDADGVLLELLHRKDTLVVDMPQAW